MVAYDKLVPLCIFACVLSVVGAMDEVRFEQLVDEYLEAGLLCHRNPGLSISVVKDGKVLLSKGYGHKKTDKKEPVTEHTLFGIASLSKSFAATLMLKQIEENKTLSLSTQLRKAFGRDGIFKSSLRSTYATIEDLLAHRIGLPSNNKIRLDDTLTRKNLIERIKHLTLRGGFRTSFYYSNLMYGLITYLSEVFGKTSWEELITEKIFTPLNMTSSTFVTTSDPSELDLATGYYDNDLEMVPVPFEFSRRWGELCGSGCVLSNSVDMSKWMLFHLNRKKNNHFDTVLKSDNLEEAHSSHNVVSPSSRCKYYSKPTTPVSLSEATYGFGWRIGHYRGYPMWSHSGSTYGYRALMTLLPNTNIGIFSVMTGDDKGYLFRTNMHLYMADLALGIEPWLDNNTVCSFPVPWFNQSTKNPSKKRIYDLDASRSLEEYIGGFENPAYGSIDIYKNSSSGQLMARIGFGQFVLYPKSTADEFFGEGFGLLQKIAYCSSFEFAFNANKTVSSITIPSFDSKDPPVFQRKYPTSAPSTDNNTSSACHTSIYIDFVLIVVFARLF